MTVGALDRAVLVADAGIVAGRRHAVMGAERFVALRQILLGVGAQIAEGRREAVAAMLLGNAAQRPQGVLQPFRQRDKAFAAEHDMGVFEAGKGQAEVIEPAVEDLAGDGDAEIGHFGEVRQSHPARRMLLAKDHLLIRAVHRPPSPDASLERPPRSSAQVRMPAAKFLEDADRPQSRRGLQHRHDFIVPDIGEGISPAPFSVRLLLAGEAGILFKPVGGGRAESSLRAGNRRRMVATQVHE